MTGLGIHSIGNLSWLASNVKAIENMYRTGTTTIRASGKKISHIHAERLASLRQRLQTGEEVGEVEVVIAGSFSILGTAAHQAEEHNRHHDHDHSHHHRN